MVAHHIALISGSLLALLFRVQGKCVGSPLYSFVELKCYRCARCQNKILFNPVGFFFFGRRAFSCTAKSNMIIYECFVHSLMHAMTFPLYPHCSMRVTYTPLTSFNATNEFASKWTNRDRPQWHMLNLPVSLFARTLAHIYCVLFGSAHHATSDAKCNTREHNKELNRIEEKVSINYPFTG